MLKHQEKNALVAHFLEYGNITTELCIHIVTCFGDDLKVSGISIYGVEPITLDE